MNYNHISHLVRISLKLVYIFYFNIILIRKKIILYDTLIWNVIRINELVESLLCMKDKIKMIKFYNNFIIKILFILCNIQ